MRIENNRIVESTGVGSITIIPEDEEDIVNEIVQMAEARGLH